jgi:hypothetical protein
MAVLTAPINKKSMSLAGFKFPGQTEFFESWWGGEAVMMLAGPVLRVALATNHLPLAMVPDAITKSLLAFRELYTSEHVNLKNAYISGKHTSHAVITVINLLEHTRQLTPRDEETVSRLNILVSIMEPLLINDMNLDKGLEARLMELLLSLFYVPEEIKIMAKTGYEEDPESIRRKLPLYLKYTLRCITSCVRSPVGVLDFSKNSTSVMQIVEFLENVRDEEILANSAKVIRIVLRDDQ